MTTIVPSHSSVAPCGRQLDFRWSCCPATASSKSKSCNQPVIARFNASLSFRPMRLRRFTVCGLQNSPENRYCNVIIFVLRICSLLLAGCINSRRKRKDSIQARGIQEDLLRNQITSMNLILLLKGVVSQHL